MSLPKGPDIAVPKVVATIDNAASLDELHSKLKTVCKKLLSPWENLDDSDLTVRFVRTWHCLK